MNGARGHINSSHSVAAALATFGVLGGLLLVSGIRDYSELYMILDTGAFLLSGMLAVLCWNMGTSGDLPFFKWMGTSFAVTSLLEAIHALVVVEWSSPLASIARIAQEIRPATWPPSAYILAIGIGSSVWIAHSRSRYTCALLLTLLILGSGLLAAFNYLPRYSPPAWLGITRPTLALVPLLWATVGTACWRFRKDDRVLPVLASMAAVLFLAHVSMLYSRAPHDTPAMLAHLGKLCGYMVMLLALMRMTSSDMRERITSGQKFKSLLESAPDAIVIVDNGGDIVLVNSQTEKLFGYSRDEILGRKIEVLLPARHREEHPSRRGAYFSDPRVRPMGMGLELSGQRRDGTEFPVEISLSPLETGEGTLVMSAIRDITLRKKSELKFRDLLESAPDAIVIVNREGTIVRVNSQTEKLFGYSRADLLQEKIEVLIPMRYRANHPGLRNKFFSDPKVRPMGVGLELFGLRKDGSEFPIEISLSPLDTEEGLLVSGAIRDITDRKRFERALQDKNLELASAMRAKDHFLASMSHELRTPLNAIIGFTGTLLMKLPGPLNSDQDRQLRTVQTSAKHLLALINDLLDIAKIESGNVPLQLEQTDCKDVVDEVAAFLLPQVVVKGLKFTVAVPGGLTVRTDRRALSQIVINLTNNAIKFTERGSVTIHAQRREAVGSRTVEISIEDTGIGIRAENLVNLFAAFSQVDPGSRPGQEGTGLGLHVSRKLAEALGGRIDLKSEFGKGSTFTLVLPGQ